MIVTVIFTVVVVLTLMYFFKEEKKRIERLNRQPLLVRQQNDAEHKRDVQSH